MCSEYRICFLHSNIHHCLVWMAAVLWGCVPYGEYWLDVVLCLQKLKDTLNSVQTWHMELLYEAKRCDRHLAGKTFLTAPCSSLYTEWVTHITSGMTRIQWGSISGEQGSVTELSVPQSHCVCACYLKHASLVLITLSLSPSLPPFSLDAFPFTHNIWLISQHEVSTKRVPSAACLTGSATSAEADIWNRAPHGTPTNPLEYENLCLNLLQVLADSCRKANTVLFS